MRASSRLISYKPQSFGIAGCGVLGTIVCIGLCALWIYPLLSLFALVAVFGLFFYERLNARWYFKHLISQRVNESFNTFSCAQDLMDQDLTHVDTFTQHVVYEEIQLCLPIENFPLRWSDNLYSDLCLEGDDIEGLIERIAQRTNRSIKHTALNPLFGKIHSVGDLIVFFNYQPFLKDPNGLADQSAKN